VFSKCHSVRLASREAFAAVSEVQARLDLKGVFGNAGGFVTRIEGRHDSHARDGSFHLPVTPPFRWSTFRICD
jgi:hypothetical protein